MSDVNHQQLLDRFDEKSFKKKLSYISFQNALVHYYRLKEPNTKLSVENFETFFSEAPGIELFSFKRNDDQYKVVYAFSKEKFDFYLNDKLAEERYVLFLENDVVKDKEPSEIYKMQEKDFIFLAFNQDNIHLKYLWLSFYEVDIRDKLLQSSISKNFYNQNFNIYAYDYFKQFFDFAKKKYDWLEEDKDVNGFSDRFENPSRSEREI